MSFRLRMMFLRKAIRFSLTTKLDPEADKPDEWSRALHNLRLLHSFVDFRCAHPAATDDDVLLKEHLGIALAAAERIDEGRERDAIREQRPDDGPESQA